LFCFTKNKSFLNDYKTRTEIYFKRFRFSKNGNLFFGLASAFLFIMTCFSCETFASFNGSDSNHTVFFNSFFDDLGNKTGDSLFVSQAQATELETPDLKIIQDNTLGGVCTPYIVSTKVLGNVFGGNSKNSKVVVEYSVQIGDTLQSISLSYGISANTLLWANDLTNTSKLKVGQSLVILPTDGVLHVVKSGDTIMDIAKKYSADQEEIISFNELETQDDIYIGDILVIPNGVMPKASASSINSQNNQTAVASSYFINPTAGKITQGIHYYNAIDVANKCGTAIYAASSGTIQRVKYGYNFGGGNLITILHSNGTVTYYGHLMTIFVKPGDKVNIGDRVALMGGGTGTVGDGLSTGCHLHFQVVGAKNPLSVYRVGSTIKLK
jgi:murein DD-endopeptidase MepM/ murein hydrolase activator NlpD